MMRKSLSLLEVVEQIGEVFLCALPHDCYLTLASTVLSNPEHFLPSLTFLVYTLPCLYTI